MPIRVFSEAEKKEIREKMFQNGLELIKKYGLTHTSVQKITKESGIGKSTFYNFFPSKEMFVIELIKYERSRTMKYISSLLNENNKIPVEKAKELLKMVIFHQDSIYQYLTEEDLEVLYPVMKEEGFIEEDLNSETPKYLLSHFENANPDANPKVFVNFLRIMALAITQKEAMYADALEETYEKIFDTMFQYIFISEG